MVDLLKIRKQYNLSQEEFSKILWVSRPTFSDIEQWKRWLKKNELQNLASALEISVDELNNVSSELEILPDRDNPYYKFKQVLLYIINKCAWKPNVWKTVLNKLLYFCDFDYFEKFWESITGVDYIKKLRWPVPEVMDLVIDSMVKRQEIKEVEVPYYNFKQIRLIPLISSDLSVFNAQELAQINEIIHKYSDKSADWLTNRSHWDMPWKATPNLWDKISYWLCMYRDNIYAVSEWEDDED